MKQSRLLFVVLALLSVFSVAATEWLYRVTGREIPTLVFQNAPETDNCFYSEISLSGADNAAWQPKLALTLKAASGIGVDVSARPVDLFSPRTVTMSKAMLPVESGEITLRFENGLPLKPGKLILARPRNFFQVFELECIDFQLTPADKNNGRRRSENAPDPAWKHYRFQLQMNVFPIAAIINHELTLWGSCHTSVIIAEIEVRQMAGPVNP